MQWPNPWSTLALLVPLIGIALTGPEAYRNPHSPAMPLFGFCMMVWFCSCMVMYIGPIAPDDDSDSSSDDDDDGGVFVFGAGNIKLGSNMVMSPSGRLGLKIGKNLAIKL